MSADANCVNCGHDGDDHDAGQCSARMNGELCFCPGYTPAEKAASR